MMPPISTLIDSILHEIERLTNAIAAQSLPTNPTDSIEFNSFPKVVLLSHVTLTHTHQQTNLRPRTPIFLPRGYTLQPHPGCQVV